MVTKQFVAIFLIGSSLILLGAGFWWKKSIFLIKQYGESSITDKEGLSKSAGLYIMAIGVMIFLAAFLSQLVGIYAWIVFGVMVSLSSVLMLKIMTKYV
ncbi:hypothetical protein [Pseudalkalibacillus salsuginis]|uniref:hypothetical protein n=1 Tax=Pseudalkalibacillus salsuginis TaxID=2910972 RepID=UPI001F1D87B6|nr:hypothetical protein [Pseudalkalibacillus salsuginis]MCF6411178.1 hypothetical protein [Pseudalkalibacillus salsuginis]